MELPEDFPRGIRRMLLLPPISESSTNVELAMRVWVLGIAAREILFLTSIGRVHRERVVQVFSGRDLAERRINPLANPVEVAENQVADLLHMSERISDSDLAVLGMDNTEGADFASDLNPVD